MPERVPAAPVQVTVHSIGGFLQKVGVLGQTSQQVPMVAKPFFDDFLHFVNLTMLQCSKNTRTIANKRAFLHAPVVSSTL
jgi:hypothetical protein